MLRFLWVLAFLAPFLGWGEGERLVNRLHGFALSLPEGWRVVLKKGGLSSPTWRAPCWCGACP